MAQYSSCKPVRKTIQFECFQGTYLLTMYDARLNDRYILQWYLLCVVFQSNDVTKFLHEPGKPIATITIPDSQCQWTLSAYTLRAENFITARTILTRRNVYAKRILKTDTRIYTPIGRRIRNWWNHVKRHRSAKKFRRNYIPRNNGGNNVVVLLLFNTKFTVSTFGRKIFVADRIMKFTAKNLAKMNFFG